MGFFDGLGDVLRQRLQVIGAQDQANRQQGLQMLQAGFQPRDQGSGLQELARTLMAQPRGPQDYMMAPWHKHRTAVNVQELVNRGFANTETLRGANAVTLAKERGSQERETQQEENTFRTGESLLDRQMQRKIAELNNQAAMSRTQAEVKSREAMQEKALQAKKLADFLSRQAELQIARMEMIKDMRLDPGETEEIYLEAKRLEGYMDDVLGHFGKWFNSEEELKEWEDLRNARGHLLEVMGKQPYYDNLIPKTAGRGERAALEAAEEVQGQGDGGDALDAAAAPEPRSSSSMLDRFLNNKGGQRGNVREMVRSTNPMGALGNSVWDVLMSPDRRSRSSRFR